MCYKQHIAPVGIRELRQRASELVRRVERGETIQVTDRGRPVAILSPAPRGSGLDRMRALGEIEPATDHLDDLPERLALAPGTERPSETRPGPPSVALHDALLSTTSGSTGAVSAFCVANGNAGVTATTEQPVAPDRQRPSVMPGRRSRTPWTLLGSTFGLLERVAGLLK